MNSSLQPDFEKMDGLVPAIIQHELTGRVLMLGFMNREAWEKTLATRHATFYSRTRQRLWTKGEESGNFLLVKKMLLDCDIDTLLLMVEPLGPTCHTGDISCFGQENADKLSFIAELQALIHDRKAEMPEDSYTTKLFRKGINKIAQKLGEEAVELIIEAKDEHKELFLGEAADLLFHYLVLLSAKGQSLEDVIDVLRERHRK